MVESKARLSGRDRAVRRNTLNLALVHFDLDNAKGLRQTSCRRAPRKLQKLEFKNADHFRKVVLLRLLLLSLAIVIFVLKKARSIVQLGRDWLEERRCVWNGMPGLDLGSISPGQVARLPSFRKSRCPGTKSVSIADVRCDWNSGAGRAVDNSVRWCAEDVRLNWNKDVPSGMHLQFAQCRRIMFSFFASFGMELLDRVILFACPAIITRHQSASRFCAAAAPASNSQPSCCYFRCREDFICNLWMKRHSIRLGAINQVCPSNAEGAVPLWVGIGTCGHSLPAGDGTLFAVFSKVFRGGFG